MELIDEVIGSAKCNATYPGAHDHDAWAAHYRNCLKVKVEIEDLKAMLRAARKSIDPVIQFKLADAIDKATNDEQPLQEKPCTWCGAVHAGGCDRMISGGQSD